jgi:hypothetical protein
MALRLGAHEGQVVDVELEELLQTHGVQAALEVLSRRRYERHLLAYFLNPMPPGADPLLPTIDLKPLSGGKETPQ